MTYDPPPFKPVSVNYHFSRRCNYNCRFCFHSAKSSDVLDLSEAKRGLKLLFEAGMEKLNICGGEPLLYPLFAGELARFCKVDLALPSVSIVTNGSRLTDSWMREYAEYVDIIAVSCDSFDDDTNVHIGRSKNQRQNAYKVSELCKQYGCRFKLNTVVCTLNVGEDMNSHIAALNPCRWKVFQCLLLEGENTGKSALKNAEDMVVSSSQFNSFILRHEEQSCLVPESNETMQNSYLILDEHMSFLNCEGGSKQPSKSILEVGVAQALRESGFDQSSFVSRGGVYNWTKADSPYSIDW
ncbi:hypothetical protein P9112_012003 [Eukaryota sp. TZLM1-RC]